MSWDHSPDDLRELLARLPDACWIGPPRGPVRYVNAAAARLLGWPDAGDHELQQALTVGSRAVFELEVLPALQASGSWTGELTLAPAGGDRVPAVVTAVAAEGLRWIALVARDVRALRSREDVLRHGADHDALTGLRHRDSLAGSAAAAVAATGAVVLLCDVDDLKAVNDIRGHRAGDAVLQEVAARLRAACDPGAHLARVGDDEFAVVLPGVDLATGRAAADRLRLALSAPYGDLRLTVSIGVALVSRDASAPGTLLRDADLALYLAKSQGPGRVEVHDPAEHDRIANRRRIAADLGFALEREEHHLEYQPIVDLASGRVIAVESLLRWTHPELGPVGPVEFVPILESTGGIIDVGRWVIDRAAAQGARWAAEDGLDRLAITVNVSALQLSDALVHDLERSCERRGFPPGRLTLELTESVLARDPAVADRVLRMVRERGFRIALDDFGTGYSSLAQLQAVEADYVKIDRSFVLAARDDASLIQNILAITGDLGLDAVAEGIETEQDADLLRSLGCRFGQGYYWSRPVLPEAIPALIRG